jgi:glycine/D-amino acid oxidase-like deaminating enzyme
MPDLHQNGLLLLNQDSLIPDEEPSLRMYDKAGLKIEKLSPEETSKRWSQIKTTDLDHVLYDPYSGYLKAREGCFAVVKLFEKEGGKFIEQQATQETIQGGKISSVTLSDGTKLEADNFVFACGPWITRQFPEITKKIKITRQGYFFFASPPGEADHMENRLPCWLNRPSDGILAYGIPGNTHRGFKVALTLADDITNTFDTYNRYLKPEELANAQQVLAARFPKMAGRPVIEQRVCQYTETPDKNFILDQHPDADNLWIIGGGSGHGYKHGAAFGEIAANTITGEKALLEKFTLKRLLI